MSGRRYPVSMAIAQNHNKHSHATPPDSSTPTSSALHQDHTRHSNPSITHTMPPTPPADSQRLAVPTTIRRGPGVNAGEISSSALPLPAAKFGAPSFASVVSSLARSPLPAISSLQQQKHKQEHVQSLAAPLAPTSKAQVNGSVATNTTSIASTNNEDDQSPALTSSSRYHSPMASPLTSASAGNKDGNNDHYPPSSDTLQADSTATGYPQQKETPDLNAYLNAHRLHDSAAQMHGLVDPGDASSGPNPTQNKPLSHGPSDGVSTESPAMPAGPTFNGLDREQQQHQYNVAALTSSMETYLRVANSNSTDNSSAKSLSPLPLSLPLSNSPSNNALPQIQAPVHSTIPLPEVEDTDQSRDFDARHLQQLHHHQRDHASDSATYGSSIELPSLNNLARNQPQRAVSYGLPTSQSENHLSVTTAFNTTSSGGTSPSSSTFPSSVSESALGNKTPNVYINGLPPHFPEDQLFALAAPFGEIRSVRTFTRHVRDSESGYGFVLFETVEAAERCIVSLRRYRNLHPTFSKQIHKIPGTTYAQGSIPSSVSWAGQGHSSDSGDGTHSETLGADATFKAKMESLQDPTSTNLYMEGLPLSIDEPTLAALVSPHRISSSRFFQTRLSNPPRIIAFVRLETREGAEEIIERLHGRMVRGWNDAGSRISVRFADTSEQRELRRTERAAQEGDSSPARLTIAQAALLNLRGQDLRSTNAGPVIHAHSAVGGRLPSASRQAFGNSSLAPDFASNAHGALPPVIGHTGANLEVDYSLAPGRGLGGGQGLRSRSPYHSSYSQLGLGQTPLQSPMDPSMTSAVDAFGRNGNPYRSASGVYDDYSSGDVDYSDGQGVFGRQQQQHQLMTSQSMDSIQKYARPAPVYTRSGYTPTEEYIMRAHAESTALAQAQAQQQQAERRRPAPLDLARRRSDEDIHDEDGANIGVGVRGYRAQASIGRLGQGVLSPSLNSLATMGLGNTISEDEFHASAVRNDFKSQLVSYGDQDEGDATGRTMSVGSTAQVKHNPNIHPAHVNARLSRNGGANYQVQRPPMPLSPSLTSPPSNQDSSNFSDLLNYQHAAAHMRATTLPQHQPSTREGQQQLRGHYQHSSMSMPAQNLKTPQHASVAVLSGNRGVEGAAGGTIYEGEVQEGMNKAIGTAPSATGHRQASGSKGQYPNSPMFGDMMSDTAASSPSLISPTLTYSSQTPSTLSPATPFFGSFNSQSEGLDKGHGLDQHQQQQQKKVISPTTGMNPSSLRSISGSH